MRHAGINRTIRKTIVRELGHTLWQCDASGRNYRTAGATTEPCGLVPHSSWVGDDLMDVRLLLAVCTLPTGLSLV